jgi:hypothetical protein
LGGKNVSRENLPWLGPAALLLIGGWLVSQRMPAPSAADPKAVETFREWLWGTRSLDLAAQVGIIFVGALGIAALLPRGDETPPLPKEGPSPKEDPSPRGERAVE